MDLTTNSVVITDAIKFVQTNKEKLTSTISNMSSNGQEYKEPNYDDKELEEEQEKKTEELNQETTNHVF
jgi:hypothetical protein